MGIEDQIARLQRDLTEARTRLRETDDESTLQDGGGGGTFGGMEARLAKLEAHMEHVRGDLVKLADVPVQLATLIERSSHGASKQDLLDMERDLAKKVQIYLAIAVAIIAIVTFLPKLIAHFGS